MKKIGIRLLQYFFNGLLLVLPLSLTAYLIVEGLGAIDRLVPVDIPGLGLLIILGGITFLGFLARSLIVGPLLKELERILTKAPLIKILYTSIRDLLEAFVGDKRKFNQPVIFKTGDAGIYRPGFVTREDLSVLGEPGLCAVYVPQSYAFAGHVFLIERELLKPLDLPAAEAMKFMVSGGVTGLEGQESGRKKMKND
jgi:uncharacterized membrane protein